MALTNPLWLGPVEGQEFGPAASARIHRGILDVLFTEGVLGLLAGDLRVTAGTGMNVSVASGRGIVDGDDVAFQGAFLCQNEGAQLVTVPPAPSANSRIDVLVLRVYDGQTTGSTRNENVFEVVSGGAAASPAAPQVPGSAIELARWTTPAGLQSMVGVTITDRRVQSGQASIAFRSVDLQAFPTSGTWTKPANAKAVRVILVGGGSSGGTGAAGSSSATGGVGGNGGEYTDALLDASVLGSTEAVVVGAGAASTAASNSGASFPPNGGGTTTFGPLRALGGSPTRTPRRGGVGAPSSQYVNAGTPGGSSDGGGGGGAGGKDTFNGGQTGGAAAPGVNEQRRTQSIATSPAQYDGVPSGGPGGAGGVFSAGSPGGYPGGGGGGGGSSSSTGYAGGKGGDGLVVVLTYT